MKEQSRRVEAVKDMVSHDDKNTGEMSTRRPRLAIVFLISTIVLALVAVIVFKSLFGIVPEIGTLAIPSIPGVFVILLMLAFNLIVRSRKLSHMEFSQGEILLTYIIIAVGGLILDRGLLKFFVFTPMGLQNIVLGGLDDANYGPFFEQISRLIVPKSLDAIQGFYLGGVSVPWGDWIFPIILWSVFFFVFIFVVMCVTSCITRYWNDIEHLPYPVSSVISKMSALPGVKNKDSIWTNKITWIGMIVSGVWALSNMANRYIPVIPALPYAIPLGSLIEQSQILPLMAWYYIGDGIVISPLLIGVLYLVQLDVLFSMWFVWLLQCVVGYLNFYFRNAAMEDMFALWPDQVRLGGLLGIGIVTIWLCRHEIAQIIKAAISGTDPDPRGRTMNPAVTFYGAILGLVFLVVFVAVFLKLHPLYSILFFIVAILGPTIALARVRAEAGVPTAGNPTASFLEQGLFQPVLGTDRMGPIGLFKFQYVMPISYGSLPAIMATMMESYKMGDNSRVSRKMVTAAVIFAVVIALVIGWPVALNEVYDKGAVLADSWMVSTGGYTTFYASLGGFGATFKDGSIIPVFVLLGSVGVTIVILMLRSKFIWWPIHPIGYAMSLNGWLRPMFPTFILVWLIKLIIVRYEGSHVYNRLKPFFIGLVIGHATIETLGTLLGLALPTA